MLTASRCLALLVVLLCALSTDARRCRGLGSVGYSMEYCPPSMSSSSRLAARSSSLRMSDAPGESEPAEVSAPAEMPVASATPDDASAEPAKPINKVLGLGLVFLTLLGGGFVMNFAFSPISPFTQGK